VEDEVETLRGIINDTDVVLKIRQDSGRVVKLKRYFFVFGCDFEKITIILLRA